MLVLQEDRDKFLSFIKNHLNEQGIALVLTMGDGEHERESDRSRAFDKELRVHQETGKEVSVASTSCKIVSFDTLTKELISNGFSILETGITEIEGSFPAIMYAVIK